MTEEYPMPPTDNNGEYRWLHSVSYVILKEAVERLKKYSAHADMLGGHNRIIIYYFISVIYSFCFLNIRCLF